ncbi:MAG TPA: radical SAM family heme chaperone HemW [Steroidobacteraceae bacterium]|jgi:oxygen-independent coproporphyrinogen-3 oxidase
MPLAPPPLSLYVHLPWCVRKCPYCDFNSHVAPALLPQADYVAALLEDLEHDLPHVAGRPLQSIFFGGGTPSLFSPEEIGRFLSGVRQRVACVDDIEVTLEANPGTIEHGRFSGYRDAGITRVSLGAQTFDAAHLKVLGRIHGSDDIQRAVAELARAGIDNFNLDLMYALPAQSCAQAVADVQSAIALGPQHVSHYQLTLEPGTVFYHRPPPLPDQDLAWEMQVECQAVLAAHGYEQYEVSAYSRPGARCRHNLNYWQFGDYIGIGAGAHGKLTLLESSAVMRTTRQRQPREYLRSAVAQRVTERRTVEADELPFEYMLNLLRLLDGFELGHFEALTGLSREAIAAALAAAERKGLIGRVADRPVDEHWRPTELGMRFLNELQEMFLPDAKPRARGFPFSEAG